MSDNINTMNYQQLRNEVQLLRDELAMMKRMYEDILYNLDTDNFSQRIVKQGENMYTKIEQTADKIELQAEKVEENSKNLASLKITADDIQSEVFEKLEDGTFAKVSRITQNAESITSEVENRISADEKLSTRIQQTAEDITLRVGNLESGKYGDYTLFKQSDDTFLFDGKYMNISAAIILTDNKGNRAFSIFHNEGGDTTPGVYMWGTGDYQNTPIIIGEARVTQGVYLYSTSDDNHIATRGWVRDNGGSTAVFA